MPNTQSKFCYTVNNYTPEALRYYSALFAAHDDIVYHVFGRETGANGTPHLQGYIVLEGRRSLGPIRALLPRSHVSIARGTPRQASEYCKKEGDFEEFGELPTASGRPSRKDEFANWLFGLDYRPSDNEVATKYPDLFIAHARNILQFRDLVKPLAVQQSGEFRGWQSDLAAILDADPDDRTIQFIIDAEGGKGKTWFCRKYAALHPAEVQVLSIGKRDDIAHAINPAKKVFFFNIPRGGMEFLRYEVLEMLKDRIVFSPKYESTEKVLAHDVHVVVFCNEFPNMNALTTDRYLIKDLSEDLTDFNPIRG